MSFLNNVAADLAAVNQAEIANRQAQLQKAQLLQTVDNLSAILSGAIPNPLVDETTERVLRFVRLGGLSEHEATFREFFTKRPDLFFIYAFDELWKALGQNSGVQDFIGEVYYHRGVDYTPKNGSTAEFPWAVKGTLSILRTAGADAKMMSGVARELIAKHANLLNGEYEPVRRMLLNVETSGQFRIPQVKGIPGMKAEDPADPHKVATKEGQRPRQGGKTNKAPKHQVPVTSLHPTGEDEVELREYRRLNKPPANNALATAMANAV